MSHCIPKLIRRSVEALAVLAALHREKDNSWVIADGQPGSLITDLQKPWRRIRARRLGGHANF